ncbi:MAG TPA: MFS transporter [Steroidobacteraceae bacterium]|jgi:MFS family permease
MQAGSHSEGQIESVVYKVAWRVMPLMVIGVFFNFVDRANLSFAANTMNRDLGFSQTVYGFAAGLFFLAYLIFGIPSNLMLQRFGSRIWFARIMITWGLISSATALVSNALELNIARFALGMAEAGYAPGILVFCNIWFPQKYRAQTMSFVFLAPSIAGVITAPISGFILELDGAMGFKGWQWLFFLEGLPTVVLGFIFLWLFPSRPADAKWLTKEECTTLTEAVERDNREAERIGGSSLVQALLNMRVILLCLANMLVAACIAVTFAFLPQIIKATGAIATASSFLATIPYLSGAIAVWIVGGLSKRYSAHDIMAPLASGMAGLGFAGTAILGTSPWAVATLTVCACGVSAFVPLFWALPQKYLTGTSAAVGFALINSVAGLGGFFGTTIFGWVTDLTGNYSRSLWLSAGAAALAGLLCIAAARIPWTSARRGIAVGLSRTLD